MTSALHHIFIFKGTIFIHYFENCQYLKKLLPWKKMILDIRSLSINKDENQRIQYDSRLKKTCKHFDFVTIISEGLRKKLKLPTEKSAILPLGSDVISRQPKTFESLKLLYVGTLNGRNIAQTIKGLSIFCKKYPQIQNISYDIIGDGSELEEIKELVAEQDLSDKITLHGRIPHFELSPYFDKCNIGISYVPVTDYYEHQPVTKTYEYILSGMACIATNTFENKIIINNDNGVLCDDSPLSFAQALERITANQSLYNSAYIQNTLKDHTWQDIVENKLIPLLNSQ
jgi:glycosyltransferase involved in cell wall biosynthesis